jgi:protease-4
VGILRFLWLPFRFVAALIARPFRVRRRKNALKKDGWVELHLEGQIFEHRPVSRVPALVRRLLRREEEPRVVLSRLRRFAEELISDPHARGMLVRIGSLGGGWVSAIQIREQLDRIREAGKSILVYVADNAGNREFLIASGATHLLLPPSGALAAVGAAGSTLFLKDTLAKAGIKFEVASRGRYKSAPEQFTRTSRSENDLEQTKALIDELDTTLIRSIAAGRDIAEDDAKALLDRAPIVGVTAQKLGFCDGVARDEDLPEEVRTLEGKDKPPEMLGAGTYLAVRELPPIFKRKKKRVGIVEVHGTIVDRAPQYGSYFERIAAQKAVVNDLRAALADPGIHAVVLHVNSRGGSVTASDAIYAAVNRLNQEKPVIACFQDVAASGGYYVACGARAIVCSPLTVTGSIGVFAMYPLWPELGSRIGIHHDVVKNRLHAALYDPWREIDEETRKHADEQVGAMYDLFISLVAEARNRSKDEIDRVAQGRVWSGRAAQEHGLIDGLGGMIEAIDRAQSAAGGGVFESEPVLVRSRRHHGRPLPFDSSKKKKSSELEILAELVAGSPGGAIARELVLLALSSSRVLPLCAYAPIDVS